MLRPLAPCLALLACTPRPLRAVTTSLPPGVPPPIDLLGTVHLPASPGDFQGAASASGTLPPGILQALLGPAQFEATYGHSQGSVLARGEPLELSPGASFAELDPESFLSHFSPQGPKSRASQTLRFLPNLKERRTQHGQESLETVSLGLTPLQVTYRSGRGEEAFLLQSASFELPYPDRAGLHSVRTWAYLGAATEGPCSYHQDRGFFEQTTDCVYLLRRQLSYRHGGVVNHITSATFPAGTRHSASGGYAFRGDLALKVANWTGTLTLDEFPQVPPKITITSGSQACKGELPPLESLGGNRGVKWSCD